MKGNIERAVEFFQRMWLEILFSHEKRFLFIVFLLVVLWVWSSPGGYCQNTGCKYLTNHTPKDYNEQPQNWWIVQDKRGIIYVANQGCLLEYDGVSWRKIEIINNNVRSLAIDVNGTIYIGGNNEIGFLAPDSKGELQYQSLRDYIDKDKRKFTAVYKILETKEGIYFGTYEYNFLFWWNAKQKKVEAKWPGYNFYHSFICEGKLFTRDNKLGLLQRVKDSFEVVPGGKIFALMKMQMMLPYDSQKILIGTRYNGLFIYETGVGITEAPWKQIQNYVKEKGLYHGIRLSSGDFALATLGAGLFIIDSGGRIKHVFNKDQGLQNDDVKHVFEDSQGNLWLGLSKGISKIEYHSPISVYDDRFNLPGIVLSVTRHGPNNGLYAGTSRGLYFLYSSGKFIHIPGITGHCFFLLSTGDSLLAATEKGIFCLENDPKPRRIIPDSSYVLCQSQMQRRRFWVGTKQGLVSLYKETKNGQWLTVKFKNITQEIRTIVEDKNGNLWLGILPKGVLKVPFPVDKIYPHDVTPLSYDESNELPPEEVQVFMAAGRVLFGTARGLYFFNEEKNVFISDPRFGEEFADGSREVFRLIEDKSKNIWFHSKGDNFQAIPMSDGSYDLNREPSLISSGQVNAIYPDPDGNIIWFASHEGLIRYDTRMEGGYDHDFHVFIRQVLVNGSDVIFCGYKRDCEKNSIPSLPALSYDERNLRFEFAAPFFKNEAAIEYQYLLEGLNNEWSELTRETQMDYAKLDSGRYTFRVRAENAFGNLSNEAVFPFKILLPWYKTWWAFLSYVLLAFLIVYPIIVKWRSWRLHQEKQRLEQVVKERTKEINEKNEQLEKQTVQLQEQSEKLKELDQAKSRFFANISHEFRTPLTLIMGPLEQMLTDDHEKDQDRKDRVKLMLRNSQRLLNLINQLLDLSKLDSGKMKLQAARQNIVTFLKGLKDSFHFLAAQNKLELTFHTEEEDITLYYDLEKLEKVICNLLSNAIKFTPPGGKITIKVKINPTPTENFPSGCAAISVADTGVGIPREQLEHIFDRFYQAGVSGEHEQKGSGIGLALTKELVTLHHGNIDVKSSDGTEGENSGTEFILRLPLGKEHLTPEEIVDLPGITSQRQKSCEAPQLYAVEKDEEEPDIEEQDIELETQEEEIILVVEDSRDVRKYIRGPLEKHYTVVEAVNGREGIEKAREIIPDLVISDIMMPEADGYELCSVLKQDVLTSHIPIVLLTAKASEENVVQGLETGADDYITKPFNTKILMARIRNLIDLRRQLQQKMKRQMMLQPAEISVSSIDEEFLTELQGTIEKNLTDPEFTVEELGKKLYMSRASLYRKIQALTGESPNHFIRNYRLKRAAQLLKENFGNVTEVAFEVGFSSSAYFTKCFKEQFQQLPSSYQASESPGTTH